MVGLAAVERSAKMYYDVYARSIIVGSHKPWVTLLIYACLTQFLSSLAHRMQTVGVKSAIMRPIQSAFLIVLLSTVNCSENLCRFGKDRLRSPG